jgi:hypothetical protein
LNYSDVAVLSAAPWDIVTLDTAPEIQFCDFRREEDSLLRVNPGVQDMNCTQDLRSRTDRNFPMTEEIDRYMDRPISSSSPWSVDCTSSPTCSAVMTRETHPAVQELAAGEKIGVNPLIFL